MLRFSLPLQFLYFYKKNPIPAPRCPHIGKALNFNSMKKALKQLGSVGECKVRLYFLYNTDIFQMTGSDTELIL